MNQKTLAALRSSIKKWDLVAAGTGPTDGANNCSLCELFFDNGCKGCPVFQLTKQDGCVNTPYGIWQSNLVNGHDYETRSDGEYAKTPLAVNVARAEASFLRALLPKRR